MPLLGKEVFVRHQLPSNISPNEEVFVCKTTNEAFLTYDEFFERQILCSSMVWTCAVSGRTGLTYVEALESERASTEMLTTFPTGLSIPCLFLMRYLNETSINTIVDMISQFINNRFFIAEEIETIVNTKRKSKGKVFRVIPPNSSEIAQNVANGSDQTMSFGLNPMLYKYEIIDSDRNRLIVGAERLTRTKGLITKDKMKLFLRHHLQQPKRTDPWTVRQSSAKELNIPAIKWDNIFAGPQPNFDDQTVIVKAFTKDKQKAYLDSKRGISTSPQTVVSKTSSKSTSKKSLTQSTSKSGNKKSGSIESSKKSSTSKPKVDSKLSAKEREKEQKLRQKMLEKEQKKQYEENMKEWSTKREDLACDDLRPLPEPVAINCYIPVDLFGDTVVVMEFLHCFNDLIDMKSIFPFGITLELMEQMITDQDINGPYADLIKVLVTTNLTLQQEDDDSVGSGDKDSDASSENEFKPSADEDMNLVDTSEVGSDEKDAVYYYNWIQSHFALQLPQLSLDSFSITEVLRLYLLSSGGGPQPRSKYRGLYYPREDPCVDFVAKNAVIVNKLQTGSVFDLKPAERLKIFHVLIHQLVTYFEFRDQMDDAFEEMSKLRKKIRDIQTEFNKWTKDNSLKRLSVKGTDGQPDTVPTDEQVDSYRREKSTKESEMSKSCDEIRAQLRRLQACYGPKPIGYDRAYRRYWLFESLPGLFVEHMKPDTQYTNEPLGPCLPEPTPNKSLKPNNSSEDNRCQSKRDSSQKSNLSDDISTNSDKENDSKESDKTGRRPSKSVFDKCTANMNTCAIHGMAHNNRAIEWVFYYSSEQLSDLLESLNSRGIRESELLFALNRDRHIVEDYMAKCQPSRLNVDIPAPVEARRSQRIQHVFHARKASKNAMTGMSVNECIVKSLRDYLLTLEDRMVSHSLALASNDSREEWQRLVGGDSRDSKQLVFKSLTKAILMLRQRVRPMCLSDALSDDSPVFVNWSQSLSECTSVSQLFVHLLALESSIKWDKSALRAYCKICRRTRDAENMLLCDRCNRGHHTYCLQPSLDSIPPGEWLCPDCSPKFKPQTPKKDKHFSKNLNAGDTSAATTDDSEPPSDDDLTSDNESDGNESEDESATTDESKDMTISDETCARCDRSDADVLLRCAKCNDCYHTECANVRRVTRSEWFCGNCLVNNSGSSSDGNHKKRKQIDIDLNGSDEDESYSDDSAAKRPKRGRPALHANRQTTGGARKALPFEKDVEVIPPDTSARRRALSKSARPELPLNYSLCEGLLKKLQKHSDGWLFRSRPNSAPKYNKVVKQYIDLGRIVTNLHLGHYSSNTQFFRDVLLMINNAIFYNHCDSLEYKASQSLAIYFEQLIRECGLDLPRLPSTRSQRC